MDRSSLDRSIDRVARGMTAGEPSAAFRERVAARLPGRNDGSGKPWFWIGGTLLAAGAAIALMVVTRAPQAPPAPAQTSAAAARPVEPAVPEGPRTQSPRTANPRTSNSRPLEPRAFEPSASQLAWESRAIPALTTPEPSAMPDIQPEPLEIRPLVTPALSVPAIDDEGR
jgi:hypothetical protein